MQATLTGFDQEATLASDSEAYTVTILPFTQRMAQRCPTAAPRRAGATSAASTAGRRLLQNSPGNTVITAPAPQVRQLAALSETDSAGFRHSRAARRLQLHE